MPNKNAFLEALTADRRLVILRMLAEAPGYEANSSVLHMSLEAFGHTPSRDAINADIEWLTEMGLVSSSQMASVYVVALTKRGEDVAKGRAIVPGVKKPSPQ